MVEENPEEHFLSLRMDRSKASPERLKPLSHLEDLPQAIHVEENLGAVLLNEELPFAGINLSRNKKKLR